MTKNSLSLCFKTGKYTIYVKHTFFEDKEAGIYVGKLEERLQEIIGLKIQNGKKVYTGEQLIFPDLRHDDTLFLLIEEATCIPYNLEYVKIFHETNSGLVSITPEEFAKDFNFTTILHLDSYCVQKDLETLSEWTKYPPKSAGSDLDKTL